MVVIATPVVPYRQAQSTQDASASFAALIDTIVRPVASATRAVFDKGMGENLGTLCVLPYGVASNNQTGSVKVTGWDRDVKNVYHPLFVCEVLCTFSSTLVGLTGQEVDTTMLYPDTLSLTSGIAVLRQGTGDLDTASFLCDVGGCQLVEITYKIGTCTSLGSMVRFQ